jgi:hypothetical protein
MARSTQNDLHPQSTSEETLNLGHAGLRSECWPGTGVPGSGSGHSVSAAPRYPALRLRRPARKRTPLHRVRPSQAAEARFTSEDYEFIQ